MQTERDRLERWYEQELLSLESDRDEGRITEEEFQEYKRQLEEECRDWENDIRNPF